ncbi:MAG: hypothetical protein B7Y40_06950 [Gammaproteobacteria bacterium 28-57-27]|nr:MAG: hypothetical protein B7Y40_06950 [Gammaproteobacteria bacterium 28-57-27]
MSSSAPPPPQSDVTPTEPARIGSPLRVTSVDGHSPRVCLFGASGFVGRSIGLHLDQIGVEWIGLSRKGSGERCRSLNAMSANEVHELLNQYPIVINASGSLKPRDFENDFQGSFNEFWQSLHRFSKLISSCRVTRLIHISSGGTVYGESGHERAREEDDELLPKSWYGRAKVIEEDMLAQLANRRGIQYVCARVSNPFGNSDAHNHGFLDVLASSLQQGRTFEARFPERASRDFIYAPVMAEMITTLALSDATGVFNVGSGISTRLADVLDHVQKLMPEAKIERMHPDIPADVVTMALSIAKYQRHFGNTQTQALLPVQYVEHRLTQRK